MSSIASCVQHVHGIDALKFDMDCFALGNNDICIGLISLRGPTILNSMDTCMLPFSLEIAALIGPPESLDNR